MRTRVLAVIVAVSLLLTHSGCATFHKSDMQTEAVHSQDGTSLGDSQWKTEERDWLLTVSIVLGLAVVIGASIAVSSGGNGFFMGIGK